MGFSLIIEWSAFQAMTWIRGGFSQMMGNLYYELEVHCGVSDNLDNELKVWYLDAFYKYFNP